MEPLSLGDRQLRQLLRIALPAAVLLLLTGATFYARPMHLPSFAALREGSASLVGPEQILEIEGLSLGRPLGEAPHEQDVERIEWLLDTLRARFGETLPDAARGRFYPTCTLHPERYASTLSSGAAGYLKRKKDKPVVSFAINLHESEAVIPAQAFALLEAINQLLPHNRVYVSIYENGSGDSTLGMLSDFGAALQALGVDGIFLHASRMLSNFNTQDRIVMLAEIRNSALKPLMPYATNAAGQGTLVFVNDVMTCASDILEVIHQRRLQQADMAMGMDWGTVGRAIRIGEQGYRRVGEDEEVPFTETTRMYDMWVSRGINGDMVYLFAEPGGYTPVSYNESWVEDAYFTQSAPIRKRWLDGLAFPVYSGWGGMAAFDASLFTQYHLRFRASIYAGWTGGSANGALGAWGQLVSDEYYLRSECPGDSECSYVARDIWNLRKGRARIVLAPQARTTYGVKDWSIMQASAPVTRREGVDKDGLDVIDWNNVTIPKTVECVPSRGRDGSYLDTWSGSNLRQRLDPLWRPGNRTDRWEKRRAAVP